MSGVVAGAVAFLVAGALVPLLVRFAVGRNLLDVPNLRSSHEVPTPRLGGIAIIAGTWSGFLVLRPDGVLPVLAAATLVGTAGLADDLSSLHFGTKIIAQTLVAGTLVALYAPTILSEAPGLLKVLVFMVGVFWIVALSNAFNFMDGIDGIVGGVALVNVAFLAALAGGGNLAALAGAIVGFLIWNVNPASMFLGDSGSYFLGFFLAATTLYAPLPGVAWSPLLFFSGVLVFTPLLFDTAYTLLRRYREGENIFSAHREHIYQRITPSTNLHRRTSNIYYGVSVLAGFAALLFAGGGVLSFVGVLLALLCCAGLLALPVVVRTGN